MYRALTVVVSILAGSASLGEPGRYVLVPFPLSVTAQGEYRNDAIDYENETRNYYRGKLILRFSRKSAFYGAYVAVDENAAGGDTADAEGRRSYTWSLAVRDASPYFSLYAGNYYVNLGCGLLAGGWVPYNPDPFFQKNGLPRSDIFSPCTSGNPLYAYRGAALAVRTMPSDEIELSLNPFYSSKDRFVDPKTTDSGSTRSGILSLDYAYERSDEWSQPVELRTWGGAAALRAMNIFTLQAHYLTAEIGRCGGDSIAFDSDAPGTDGRGIGSLVGYGVFAEYRDAHVRIFIEHDRTHRVLEGDDDSQAVVIGGGTMVGLQFRHPVVSVSAIGKSTGADYYTPYQSTAGGAQPEDACFLTVSTEPYWGLEIGASVSYERRNLLAPGEWECGAAIRERIAIRYSHNDRLSCEMSGRRYEGRERGSVREMDQLRFGADLWIWRAVGITMMGILQKDSGREASTLAGGGILVKIRSRLDCVVEYANARMEEDDRLYAVIAPMGGANIPGFFIEESSQVVAVRLGITWPPITLAARYQYQFNDVERLRTRWEFFASMKL